jgi:hypothetical protein
LRPNGKARARVWPSYKHLISLGTSNKRLIRLASSVKTVKPILIISGHDHAASSFVYRQINPSDVTRLIRRKKCNGFGDFVWISQPAKRNVFASSSFIFASPSPCCQPSKIGVLIEPGLIAFTRIRLSRSSAIEAVSRPQYRTTPIVTPASANTTSSFRAYAFTDWLQAIKVVLARDVARNSAPSRASFRRPVMNTRSTPTWTKRFAVARHMPVEAPVMTATLLTSFLHTSLSGRPFVRGSAWMRRSGVEVVSIVLLIFAPV